MIRPFQGLLDTSVIIDIEAIDPDNLPEKCFISTVTLAELSVGPLVAKTISEQMVRQVRLQWSEQRFDPLPFDVACARTFAQVSVDLRFAGRKVASRSYDAMIAATAIAHNLPLYTLNPKDFSYISRLDVRTAPMNDGVR